MKSAPLYDKISEAPKGGKAEWVETGDGVRVRVACWNKGKDGTVLIFPGRTEFIEKYGRVVGEFQKRDLSSVIVDWRGQGLSDRLVPNRQVGHVEDFGDYQLDAAALLTFAENQNLPKPWFLCAHSMGGTVGLRALHSGLPVQGACFLAPLWGLSFDPILRSIIQAIAAGSKTVGWGAEFSPGTTKENYIISNGFENNALTSDPETFAYLERQLYSNPGLAIGGPSIHWLYEALVETRALTKLEPPDYKILCMLGNEETVVDKRDIVGHIVNWPGSRLEMVKNARHEILMETPEIQKPALDMMVDFFRAG